MYCQVRMGLEVRNVCRSITHPSWRGPTHALCSDRSWHIQCKFWEISERKLCCQDRKLFLQEPILSRMWTNTGLCSDLSQRIQYKFRLGFGPGWVWSISYYQGFPGLESCNPDISGRVPDLSGFLPTLLGSEPTQVLSAHIKYKLFLDLFWKSTYLPSQFLSI